MYRARGEALRAKALMGETEDLVGGLVEAPSGVQNGHGAGRSSQVSSTASCMPLVVTADPADA